jgi:hypothetical protein
MTKLQKIHEKLLKTQLSNQRTRNLISKLLLKEFSQANQETRAFDLMMIAHHFNLPIVNQMIEKHSIKSISTLFQNSKSNS